MFKRFFWLVTGAGFGFGMSLWVQRLIKAQLRRLTPERLQSSSVAKARSLGGSLQAAVDEGRQAKRQREAELWATLDERQANRPGGQPGDRLPEQPGEQRGSRRLPPGASR